MSLSRLDEASDIVAPVGARHLRPISTGTALAYLDERVVNVTHPYYGARTQSTPDTSYHTHIQAAIDDMAAAGGGDVLIPGKIGIGGTLMMKEGVRLVSQRGVDKSAPASHVGGWLVWVPASSGTMVKVGDKDQTVSVRNAGLRGIGLDGGNRSDVTALSLGSNTRTNSLYVTTGCVIDQFEITRVGVGINWGNGVSSEQIDNILFRMGEINSLVTGHPDGSCAVRVNGSNAGDLSIMQGVRTIMGSSLAADLAAFDLVLCGALTLDNCFGGGEGTATRDWIKVTSHNGLRLVRCQSEKHRYFLRMMSSFSNDNVCVELDNCYIDDPISVEGASRIVSLGSQIKSPVLLGTAGAGARWDGFGDTIAAGSGGRVVLGSNAVFRNQRSRRATVATVYATGEVMVATPAGSGDLYERLEDIVVRGGRKGTTWAATTAYTGNVDRSWVASTAYIAGDRVTPTWGNGRYYTCTVGGTSGASEPLWNSLASSATYTDGTVTWAFGGTSTSVSSTSYVEPTVPNDHVYKLVAKSGSNLSGGVEPTWPTTSGATVTDGDLTWQETGTSALIRSQVVLFGDGGTSPPGSGYFYRGHIRWNTGPDAGENVGWICTLSGNPGTWAPFGVALRTKVQTTGNPTMAPQDLVTLCRISAPMSLTLPASPLDDYVYWIADDNGTAAANNITIVGTVSGVVNPVISTNYGAVGLVHADSRWTFVSLAYTDEQVRDAMGTALVAGTGMTVTPNDGADTITLATTITQYTDEMARDALGAALTAGAGVTITPNDGADTITVASVPTLYSWRERQHNSLCNSTTFASIGFASSPGSTGTQANADDADGANLSNTTGAVSGNTAGLTGLATTNPFRARDGTPRVFQRIKTGASIADIRLWVGMATGTMTGSATPAESYACFRYDTGADGTAFWRFVTDNGSGSPTVTVTTVAIAVSTLYDIRIEADASEIRGYVNDVLAATHTTTLPAATTLVGWQAVLTTLAASAKVFKWYRTAVLSK